jgi:hypothetical protein
MNHHYEDLICQIGAETIRRVGTEPIHDQRVNCCLSSLFKLSNMPQSLNAQSPDTLDTLVSELLKTNSLPSETTNDGITTSIMTRLAAYEAELEIMKSDIQSLCDLQSLMEISWQRLASKIQEYRSIFHPIKRLSNELLMELFRACIEQYDVREEDVLNGKTAELYGLQTMPWSLSHVSRHWRQIALFFPFIWSKLYI